MKRMEIKSSNAHKTKWITDVIVLTCYMHFLMKKMKQRRAFKYDAKRIVIHQEEQYYRSIIILSKYCIVHVVIYTF